MKTQLMRHFAVALGFSVCGFGGSVASAQTYGYPSQPQSYSALAQGQTAPSYQADANFGVLPPEPPQQRWGNFRPPTQPLPAPPAPTYHPQFHAVAMQTGAEELPMPTPTLDPASPTHRNHTAPRMPQPPAAQQPMHAPAQVSHPAPASQQYYHPQPTPAPAVNYTPASDCESCQTDTCAPVPCATGPRPISPWFGGMDLLFWSLSETGDHALVTYDDARSVVRTGDIQPGSALGYDVHFGRYLGCGSYGLDIGYLNWDPSSESREASDGGSGLRLTMPALQGILINRGAGATSVYDDYDNNSTRIRVDRDLSVQGVEVNLFSFGLIGARRLGNCSPRCLLGGRSLGKCLGHGYGFGLSNCCSPSGCASGGCDTGRTRRPGFCCRGNCGGATGPLARACSGRIRVQTSCGFRWFQLKDELGIVGDVDGDYGYGANDLWYDIETENNLYGYQFGSRLTYCLGCRAMLNIGGKFGIYANDARFRQRIGTRSIPAYHPTLGAGPGDVTSDESDTALAGLGELDLGLGYRVCNCVTLRGGYRFLAASGVATAPGHLSAEYTSVASASEVKADDSLILHGAYVGFDYNW